MGGEFPERRFEENGEKTAVDAAVKRVLDDVVDDALATIKSEAGHELVTRGIGELLKDALLKAAAAREVPPAPAGNGFRAMGEATEVAVSAAKAVKDLGFVEFTSGLVNGTFDAVTGATLKQMDAYAKLVADIAKSLKEFEAENVTDAQIDAYLLQRYPDPKEPGKTLVRTGTGVFVDVPAKDGVPAKTATEQCKEVAQAIVKDTGQLKDVDKPLTLSEIYADGDVDFSDEEDGDLAKIRPKIGLLLAKGSQDALIAMARMGMARIVVTNGEILSKLTFKVSASELDQKVSQTYDQESSYWYAHGNFSLPLKFLNLYANGGGGQNKFKCTTVNETTFDTTTMSADIIGQVKIGFKTETFPPAEVPARVAAT